MMKTRSELHAYVPFSKQWFWNRTTAFTLSLAIFILTIEFATAVSDSKLEDPAVSPSLSLSQCPVGKLLFF